MTTPTTMVKDSKQFDTLISAWNVLFAFWGAKAAAAFRSFGDWTADTMPTGATDDDENPVLGLHEASNERAAIRKLLSTQASQVRGAQKRALHGMPKSQGAILDPDAIIDDEGNTVADVIEKRLFAKQKSMVHELLKATTNTKVQLNKKDGNDMPIAPTALDITALTGIDDDDNERLNNVYAAFMPSTSNTLRLSKDDAENEFLRGIADHNANV